MHACTCFLDGDVVAVFDLTEHDMHKYVFSPLGLNMHLWQRLCRENPDLGVVDPDRLSHVVELKSDTLRLTEGGAARQSQRPAATALLS